MYFHIMQEYKNISRYRNLSDKSTSLGNLLKQERRFVDIEIQEQTFHKESLHSFRQDINH